MRKFLRFTAVCLAMVLALGGCMRAEDAAEKSAEATGEVAVPEEVKSAGRAAHAAGLFDGRRESGAHGH